MTNCITSPLKHFEEGKWPLWAAEEGERERKRLTIFIQEELIKSQTTGLLPNETVHVLCAVVIDSNGVLQRLDTGLQTERDLRVSNCVSTKRTKDNTYRC